MSYMLIRKYFPEALDAYESEDWGLIPDGLLYRGLIECNAKSGLYLQVKSKAENIYSQEEKNRGIL